MRNVPVWLMVAVGSALAQVPPVELAKPPANAQHFVIESVGGKHGDSYRWIAAGGARMSRESMNLRGQVFELDSTGTVGADGMPSSIAIRGVTPEGDAAEVFTVESGRATWKSQASSFEGSFKPPRPAWILAKTSCRMSSMSAWSRTRGAMKPRRRSLKRAQTDSVDALLMTVWSP